MDSRLRDYAVITGNYWAFTVTDGALRMLVVLHFHTLGFTPFEIASLFLFYEFFGIVTNAVGGWLGARIGLNRTMQIGLLLQIGALAMLLVPETWLTVIWVMVAQAISGIAKDLNKMSAKSSMKSIARDQDAGLYRIVAFLTGSKNALKGAGFFIGAVLLSWLEFQGAIAVMVAASASFATPIGYQTNMLVYGPGGYRFTDFMRVGIPLNLSIGLLASALIPLMWPLVP